jgi:hypothetical protein
MTAQLAGTRSHIQSIHIAHPTSYQPNAEILPTITVLARASKWVLKGRSHHMLKFASRRYQFGRKCDPTLHLLAHADSTTTRQLREVR